MPFGEYEDFDDCVEKNQDKADPEAYCARIQDLIEGESAEPVMLSETDPDATVSYRATAQAVIIPASRALSDMAPDEYASFAARFGDPRAQRSPADYYPFELVASSDGLDFYFTRQDPETTFPNFVRDLEFGQAVLGNHATDTFPYGTSYGARVEDLDPTAPWYEATFYRNHAARTDLQARKAVIGSYAIARRLTLNGQSSDDLIRSIELGVNRKVSVSFTVGSYVCGIDGKDMLAGWFGPGASPDIEAGCAHFPGVEYGPEGVGWAWMKDNDLVETSLVYRNASPSAMYYRKAAELSRIGALSVGERAVIENRLQQRLPARDRRVFALTAPREESTVTTKTTTGLTVPTGTAAEAMTGPVPTPPAPTPDPAPEPPSERHSGHAHEGDTKGGHKRPQTLVDEPSDEAEDQDETLIAGEPSIVAEAPVQRRTEAGRVALLEARDAEIASILGRPLTVENVRAEAADAALGRKLYGEIVDRAVAAKVRSAGTEHPFSAEDEAVYRSMLLGARSPDFAIREIERNGGTPFVAGRQVPAADVPADAPGTRREVERIDLATVNAFASSGRNGTSKE